MMMMMNNITQEELFTRRQQLKTLLDNKMKASNSLLLEIEGICKELIYLDEIDTDVNKNISE